MDDRNYWINATTALDKNADGDFAITELLETLQGDSRMGEEVVGCGKVGNLIGALLRVINEENERC